MNKKEDAMDFWKLFFTALMPVLKVLLITSVGTILALDRFDVLRDKERKHLNTVVHAVNILLAFVIGTALGWLLIKITRAPHDMQGLVLGFCSAGNLGNLVYIIVLAVCKESSSPFGAADVCYKNGLAYASLSMAVGAICLWSYVYNIVRIYSCKSSDVMEVKNNVEYPVSAEPEMNPENLLKCSQRLFVTAEGSSEANAHVNQLEIECTVPERSKGCFIF